jgi:hypothetical protein
VPPLYSRPHDLTRDAPHADASTNPHCNTAGKLAPTQQTWQQPDGAWGIPPQPSSHCGQPALGPAFSSWGASHPSPGMVPPDFAVQPYPHAVAAAVAAPQLGASAAAATASSSALTGLGQPPHQPLLPPGAAWGPEHLRLLQQRPQLVQPGAYTAAATGPQPAGGFNSPAGS